MLTQRDLAEMADLVGRVQQGSVTREDWSNLAALTLVYQGETLLATIAAQGLDAFIATCAPIYHGHAFQHDDYVRMYDRVCAAAARAARAS